MLRSKLYHASIMIILKIKANDCLGTIETIKIRDIKEILGKNRKVLKNIET
jgi:hypothetical protein